MRLSLFALALAGASAFVQPALRTTSKLATSKVAPAQMMLEPSSVMQTTNLLAGVVAVGALQFPRNSAAHATAAYATAAYAIPTLMQFAARAVAVAATGAAAAVPAIPR